jgi:hypothetical protein
VPCSIHFDLLSQQPHSNSNNHPKWSTPALQVPVPPPVAPAQPAFKQTAPKMQNPQNPRPTQIRQPQPPPPAEQEAAEGLGEALQLRISKKAKSMSFFISFSFFFHSYHSFNRVTDIFLCRKTLDAAPSVVGSITAANAAEYAFFSSIFHFIHYFSFYSFVFVFLMLLTDYL